MSARASLIIAIVSATLFTITVIIGFTVLAQPFDLILDSLNATMATRSGMTGTAWNNFTSLTQTARNLYFPIAAGLIFFAMLWVYLHAQRREFVTGM